MQPHRLQPTSLCRPCDSPGKNTGVGCRFLLQCMKVKNESEVAQLCLTRSNSMNYSLSDSSVHGIFQTRVLKWIAIAFSKGNLNSLHQNHNSKASIFRHAAFFTIQLSHPYMTTGKTIALIRWTFADKVISLLFNMLSRLVILSFQRVSIV